MRFVLRVGVVTMGLAVAVAVEPAAAWTVQPFTPAQIVDFAAQSTAVVRARFVRWERRPDSEAGRQPDGSISVPEMYGKEALARFQVEQVAAGDAALAQKEILVVDTSMGGMESPNSTLLFLRREGEQFSQVHWGGFVVTGAMVHVQLGSRSEVPWAEIATLVRTVNLVRVAWTGTVAATATRGGTLHVELVAKNEGTAATQVLPPSLCQSVKAYPLAADGKWHARQGNWFEVPSAWMAALGEAPISLARGTSHTFRYDIPLASMKMDAADSYDVVLGMTASFCSMPAPNGPATDAGAPPQVHGNSMASRVTRVALSGGTRATRDTEAGSGDRDAAAASDGANDAGATPLGSADAAVPAAPPALPERPAGGCRGGCATAPSTPGIPHAAIAALSSLAVAFARRRRSM